MPLYKSILSIKEQLGLATGTGSGLSSNDFTTAEKSKLNIMPDIVVSDTPPANPGNNTIWINSSQV
jgi:hypothetical protein